MENSIQGFRDEYFFLSNFYEANIVVEGVTYRNNESAFQAFKVPLEERAAFSNLSGKEAKSYGRKVTLRDDWNEVRVECMRKVVYAKFSQNLDLKEKLIATGNKELIETNTWNDKFWGVCNGVGKNMLGKILMEVRDSFKQSMVENNNITVNKKKGGISMFKNLIAKVLRGLLSKVEGGQQVNYIHNAAQQNNVVNEPEVMTKGIVTGTTKNGGTEYTIVDDKKHNTTKHVLSEKEYEKYINDACDEVTARLFKNGYKELPIALAEYDTDVVEEYVKRQLLSMRTWDKEKDILEGMTKDNLIKFAVENNFEQYKLRAIESGNASISKNQMKLVKSLIDRVLEVNKEFKYSIPSNRFEASDLIDRCNKILGVDTKPKAMIGNITENQYKAIIRLSNQLQINISELPKNVQDASNVIDALTKEADKRGFNKATDKQVDYVKRLLKQLNKRWTAKRQEKFSNMTRAEISATINELKALCPEETNISEGQVRYIKDLCRQLNLPIPADLNKYDKQTATKCISKLRREHFYIVSRANGTYLSKEAIAKMSDETIKKMLKQFKMEKDTDNYQRTPQEVEDITGGMDF